MKNIAVLNINRFSKSNLEGFHANTLENHLITAHKDIVNPHSHNFFVSVLFTHGSGIHEIDFNSYEVKPGALFFLNPGQTHHWELSADTAGYIFLHTQDFYDLHYRKQGIHDYPFFYSQHTSPCLYLNDDEQISSLFAQVLQEYESEQPLKEQKLLALAEMVYIESTRLYIQHISTETGNRNNYYLKFRQMEDLIEKHFREIKSPGQYAEMMNISSKHLNRITQQVASKTAGDVILERVILEAKKQFVLQTSSLSEIAYTLGYDDYAYFSKLFKKKAGETPGSFIKKYRR